MNLNFLWIILRQKKFSFDIIALQEIWKLNYPDHFSLTNYHNIVHKSRVLRQGGGVGCYIKNKFNFYVIDKLSIIVDVIFESLVICVTIGSKKFIFASIYRPNTAVPNLTSAEQLELFNEEMIKLLEQITDLKKPAYILGDMNIDVLKLNIHKPTERYIDNISA